VGDPASTYIHYLSPKIDTKKVTLLHYKHKMYPEQPTTEENISETSVLSALKPHKNGSEFV
jgi:hypothetical protein